MQGFLLANRPIKLNTAASKKTGTSSSTSTGSGFNPMGPMRAPGSKRIPYDPENKIIFIGGVPNFVTADVLRGQFSPFGEIVNVKLVPQRACAFVEFTTHHSAQRSIKETNGTFVVGGSQVRISWGKQAHSATVAKTNSGEASEKSNGEQDESKGDNKLEESKSAENKAEVDESKVEGETDEEDEEKTGTPSPSTKKGPKGGKGKKPKRKVEANEIKATEEAEGEEESEDDKETNGKKKKKRTNK